MLRNTKFQMFLVLVTGALAGYAAASGKLNPFQSAAAGPVRGAAGDQIGGTQPTDPAGCCSAGMARGQVLALADPQEKNAVASVPAKGKKPKKAVARLRLRSVRRIPTGMVWLKYKVQQNGRRAA